MVEPLRVSVVIPAYNCESFIADALASVAAQTRAPFEVIVIDDGSTDRTVETALACRERFAAGVLRVISYPNGGLSVARNRGILAATGEIVALLDADDEFLPEHLALLVPVFEHYPDTALAFADAISWREGRDATVLALSRIRDALHQASTLSAIDGVLLLDRRVRAAYLRAPSILPSTWVMSRSALARAGLFDPANRYGEDVDLFCRLTVSGNTAWRDQPTVRRREHGVSMSGPSHSRWTEPAGLWSFARLRRFTHDLNEDEARCLDAMIDEAAYQTSYFASSRGLAEYLRARREMRQLVGRRLRTAPKLLLRSLLRGRRDALDETP